MLDKLCDCPLVSDFQVLFGLRISGTAQIGQSRERRVIEVGMSKGPAQRIIQIFRGMQKEQSDLMVCRLELTVFEWSRRHFQPIEALVVARSSPNVSDKILAIFCARAGQWLTALTPAPGDITFLTWPSCNGIRSALRPGGWISPTRCES